MERSAILHTARQAAAPLTGDSKINVTIITYNSGRRKQPPNDSLSKAIHAWEFKKLKTSSCQKNCSISDVVFVVVGASENLLPEKMPLFEHGGRRCKLSGFFHRLRSKKCSSSTTTTTTFKTSAKAIDWQKLMPLFVIHYYQHHRFRPSTWRARVYARDSHWQVQQTRHRWLSPTTISTAKEKEEASRPLPPAYPKDN